MQEQLRNARKVQPDIVLIAVGKSRAAARLLWRKLVAQLPAEAMQALALQQRPCRLSQSRSGSGRTLQGAATAGRLSQTTRCAASTGRQGGEEQGGPRPGASLVSGTLGLLAAAALATGAATSPQVRPCLACPPPDC